VVTAEKVTFVQTAGGRTGVPAPRRVRRAPFVQFSAPLAWTTVALEIQQFVGDAVMAVFGAPVPMDDHAGKAVEAALAMHAAQGKSTSDGGTRACLSSSSG
jgi:class 3 adenylate cyclase